MLQFILRRLGLVIPTFIGITLLTFAFVHMIPGDPVMIMAGGTGGHVFPALACAREFQARGYAVHWLGTPRGIENELVPAAGLPLHLIQVSGLRGKGKLSLLKAPFQLVRALFQARKVMRELQPVCVLGMGGYVTGPGGLAARMNGAPLVIHEQNAVAGTANRSLAPFAKRVCEAFPNTFGKAAKLRTTGNPVREELFLETPRDSLKGRKPRLLVLGGSLGAEPLNKLIPAALAKLPADLRPKVFHQAGKQHDAITAERYREVAVEAEVARTPEEQEKGLMFRTSLPADGGMIFPFAKPRIGSFWMKNTIIPLDMLFIHTDGTIAFIGANVAPYSREPVSAGVPVVALGGSLGPGYEALYEQGVSAAFSLCEGPQSLAEAMACAEQQIESRMRAIARLWCVAQGR